jgi:hypothetical protein
MAAVSSPRSKNAMFEPSAMRRGGHTERVRRCWERGHGNERKTGQFLVEAASFLRVATAPGEVVQAPGVGGGSSQGLPINSALSALCAGVSTKPC